MAGTAHLHGNAQACVLWKHFCCVVCEFAACLFACVVISSTGVLCQVEDVFCINRTFVCFLELLCTELSEPHGRVQFFFSCCYLHTQLVSV